MKTCPQCGNRYPDSQRFCQIDGTRLRDDPPADADASPKTSGGTAGNGKSSAVATATPQAEKTAATPATTTSNAPAARQSTARAWYRRIPRETLAGLAIIAVLLVVIGCLFAMRQAKLYRLKVVFQEGHELGVGDSVFIRGVDVGEVVDCKFEGDRFVASIIVSSDASEQFRQDSLFYVGYETLATQKRCISVYVLDPASPPLASNSTVVGTDSLLKVYMAILKRRGPQEAAVFWKDIRGLVGGSKPPSAESK